jgi:hypothetical protein
MEKVKFSSVPDRSLTTALKGAGFKYDGKSRTWSKLLEGEGAEKVLSREYDSFESVYTRKLHEAAKEKNKQRQLKLFDELDKYVASVARIDANDPEETIARISDAFDSSIKRMKTDQMGVSNLTRLSDALVKQISQISDAEVAKMYNALVASKAEVDSTTNPAYHLMRALQSAAQSRGIDLYAKIAPTKEEEQARKKGKKVPPKKEAKPRTYTKEEMGRAYKAVMSEDYAKKNPKDAELAAEMLKSGLSIGGEQSGHIILLDRNFTGDGEMTAVAFLEVIAKSGRKASEYYDDVVFFPQISVNIKADAEMKSALTCNEKFVNAVEKKRAVLGDRGRIIVRPSGTEPLVRIMVEGENEAEVKEISADLVLTAEKVISDLES